MFCDILILLQQPTHKKEKLTKNKKEEIKKKDPNEEKGERCRSNSRQRGRVKRKDVNVERGGRRKSV